MTAEIQEAAGETAGYLYRFAEYYRRQGTPVTIAAKSLWIEHNRAVVPVGPVQHDRSISLAEARDLLKRFSKALLLFYTDGFENTPERSNWYYVVLKRPTDLSALRAKERSEIRRGLKECVVRKVAAEYLAKHAYGVHARAHARYAEAQGRTVHSRGEGDFAREMLLAAEFSDIIDFWGVYVGDELVGYGQANRFGTAETFYAVIELDPAYFKAYSSYAIVHTMNEFYLRECGVAYVNDGYRSILHRTQFQDFLVNKFGFERQVTGLHIVYRPWVAAVMSCPAFLKRIAGRAVQRFAALNELDAAAVTREF